MIWNLNENLRKAARENSDKEAYVFLNQRTSYKQLDQLVDQFAASLVSKGIGKGDAVSLLLGNTPEFIIAYYGILRAGASVVPINPIYTSPEISYILSNCQAKAVVAIPLLHSILTELKLQLSHLDLVIYTEPVESEIDFQEFIRKENPTWESPIVEEDDLAVVLYTSGTTGKPKGAMLSQKNLASNAEACVQAFEFTSQDRMITVLPMFHVFCMTVCMNASIACGATMLVLPKFSPVEVIKAIRDEKATLFAGVPTMYNYLLQLPDDTDSDFHTLRVCISGGAPIPVALLHKFEEKYQMKILEGYGLSEASPATAFNPINGVRKPGSIGLDIPFVRNKIVNDEGREVPRGEVGELIVKGPNVMMGYLGMPEATRKALCDGWLYTGDLAKMDEEGYLYIVDRKKDLIIVGGYNVYPREVEEVFYEHPAVLEVAVIGEPDEDMGEVVKAYIVTKGTPISEEDLRRFCQSKLAKYKIPSLIAFIDELPKNSTGKIMKRSLRVWR